MPRHPLRAATAICGLGVTEVGRVYDRTTTDFAAEAVPLALEDAGLGKRELDGLLVAAGISGGPDLSLALALGLPELRVYTQMNAFGSTAAQIVQYAALAVADGLARHVACVFADAPARARREHRRGLRRGAARPARPRRARGRLRLRRSDPLVRPGGAAPHGPLRHHAGPARRDRRRDARLGRRQSARARFREPLSSRSTAPRPSWWSRSTCSTAAWSRTAAPA